MKTFTITANDVHLRKGGMALLMKALGAISAETPPSSRDLSFAGILNRKKESVFGLAHGFDNKKPPADTQDMTEELIGKTALTDASLKSRQTNGLRVSASFEDNAASPAGSLESPASIAIEETSFAPFSDAVLTKTHGPDTFAIIVTVDLQRGAFVSASATTEEKSPSSVRLLSDGRISLPSSEKWPEIPLQAPRRPANRISLETGPPADHAPAASNIIKAETASPDKAADTGQTARIPLTPAPVATQKQDAASMQPAAIRKDRPEPMGKAASPEQTAKHPRTPAPVATHKASAATLTPANAEPDAYKTTERAADTGQTARIPLTPAPVATQKQDAASMQPAAIRKDRPEPVGKAASPEQTAKHPRTPAPVATHKQDAASMQPTAIREDRPEPVGKTAYPEQTAKHPRIPAPVATHKASAATLTPANAEPGAYKSTDKAADTGQTAGIPLTPAPVKTQKQDAASMQPAHLRTDGLKTTGMTTDANKTQHAAVETEPADPEPTLLLHHPVKNAGHPGTAKLMDRVADLLPYREDSSAPEDILSPVRRAAFSARNDNQPALSQKNMAPPATPQHPAAVVNGERDLAAKSVFLDRMESTVELPDRAVTMKEGATAAGHDADIDNNSRLILARAANHAERESFPLRLESLSTVPLAETKAPLSDNPAGSRTQAIIDQIIDARQTMNGNFGRVRIVLSPPHLGTVDLDIVVRNERVEVVMTADNSSVQQALQSRTDDIRSALQRHDLKIESFQVLLQDHGASRQQSQDGALFEQRREKRATHDYKDGNAIPSPTSAVSFIQGSGPEKGRISIFA